MRLKRLLALALTLALTLSMLPLMASAADSTVFFALGSDGAFYAMDVASASFATWSNANPVSTPTASGISTNHVNGLYVATAAILDEDITTNYLVINASTAVTISAAVRVTQGLVFIGASSGTITINDGGSLTVGGAVFTPTAGQGGNIAITNLTAASPTNVASVTNGLANWVSADLGITTTSATSIKGYVQSANSTLATGAATTFSGVTLNAANTLAVPLTFTGANTVNGASTLGGTVELMSGATLNVNANTTIGDILTVNSGSTLNLAKANSTLTLSAAPVIKGTVDVSANTTLLLPNAASVTNTVIPAAGGVVTVGGLLGIDCAGDAAMSIAGYLDLGTGGEIVDKTSSSAAHTGCDITIATTGALRVADDLQMNGHPFTILGSGLLYTNDVADFRILCPTIQESSIRSFVGTSGGGIGGGIIGGSIVSGPTMQAASGNNNYGGFGDFVLWTSGFYKNFDPEKSLYCNDVKLVVGQDYEVNNQSGFAVFTIYESFMKTVSGNARFKATFTDGSTASANVTVQGAYVPTDITVDAPKTGTATTALGFVLVMLAGLAYVAMKKVRA